MQKIIAEYGLEDNSKQHATLCITIILRITIILKRDVFGPTRDVTTASSSSTWMTASSSPEQPRLLMTSLTTYEPTS